MLLDRRDDEWLVYPHHIRMCLVGNTVAFQPPGGWIVGLHQERADTIYVFAYFLSDCDTTHDR